MNSECATPFAVLIPAYRPTAGLVDVVAALAAKDIPAIVVIDDGSGPEYKDVFARVAECGRVHFLRHAVNMGKGAALKTGINYALCTFTGLVGVVTADADGQHHPEDIERVARTLLAQPESLVLGARAFAGEVPLRSRFGNVATSAIMHAMLGRKITDTQTGLRGIPAALLPRILRLESTGYELELEMLIAAHQLSIPIVEGPIRTIYEPGNKSSHFNPIIDSMKIYFVLLRFGSVSFLTAIVDNLVFYLAFRRLGHVLAAQVLGRVVAVTFNYSMVRRSVFYSRQKHMAVLPRYLGLVLVSGSMSYAGIQILAGKGMNPVAAKVLVETLLFFVNFAVQRLFIFNPETEDAGAGGAGLPPLPGAVPDAQDAAPDAALSRAAAGTGAGKSAEGRNSSGGHAIAWLAMAVFAAVALVELAGLFGGRLFAQEIWYPVGLERAGRCAGIYLALAVPLLVMVPWTFTAVTIALGVGLTALAVGPAAVAAALFFLIAASALGARILATKDDAPESALTGILLGTAGYIFVMGLIARFPVNYPLVWAALLALPIVFDLRGTIRRLRDWGAWIGSAELRTWGERCALASLMLVLMAHWLVALKPEASTDGLSMHLAVAFDFTAHHALTLQPGRFLWAVMPMGADWTYSISALLGGEAAARLLNFSMLLVIAALLYRAVRRWVPRSAAYLLVVLFAATPLVQLVTGGLYVENLLAAMILGALTALWRFAETGERRFWYACAALSGTAVAVKLGALAFVAVVAPFAIWEARRMRKCLGPRPLVRCALAAGVLVLTALPPYFVAWQKTGNPVFPFRNETIHSPLLDPNADIRDGRFRQPLTWHTPNDLTFHTNRWYEGQDGSFGFQYLMLAPLGLIGLLAAPRRASGAAFAVAVAGSFLVLRSEPNARYIYTALPLLAIPFAALLGWSLKRQPHLYRILISYAVAATALNAWFLPSSSYYHKDFCMRRPFSRAERTRYMAEAAPIRDVIAYFNGAHPNTAVLLTSDSNFAGLTGDVYENHWHQFNILDPIRKTRSVPELRQLLAGWKIGYVIAPKPGPGAYANPPMMRRLLANCITAEYERGPVFLGRLDSECRQPAEGPPANPTVVLRAGAYDDFDPSIVFRGDWNHDDSFEGPGSHTISYSQDPGAQALFLFEGRSLIYAYTKAPNRGMAEIVVDGVSRGSIDLYSPKVEWQTTSRFCCFDKGRHTAVLRALGRRNPKASEQYIDVDSFVVE